jgi:long-chain fatty acid transport protein
MSSGVNYYFDRNADYGLADATGKAVKNSDVIAANCFDLMAGAEYTVSKRLLLSSGYLYGKTGVSEEYQALIGFSLDSHTLGVGGQYRMTPELALNIGCSSIWYRVGERDFLHYQSVPEVLPYGGAASPAAPADVTERFSRADLILAVGIEYAIRR